MLTVPVDGRRRSSRYRDQLLKPPTTKTAKAIGVKLLVSHAADTTNNIYRFQTFHLLLY